MERDAENINWEYLLVQETLQISINLFLRRIRDVCERTSHSGLQSLRLSVSSCRNTRLYR